MVTYLSTQPVTVRFRPRICKLVFALLSFCYTFAMTQRNAEVGKEAAAAMNMLKQGRN